MKIVVVSDTHGNMDVIDRVINANPKADLYLHAGDSQTYPQMLSKFRVVKGNCDYGLDYPEELNIDTKYGKIYVTHGHRFLNLSTYLIESKNAKIFIFGHTHQKLLTKVNETYVLNPGSLSRPRDGNDGSYAIIDIDENKCEIIFKYL